MDPAVNQYTIGKDMESLRSIAKGTACSKVHLVPVDQYFSIPDIVDRAKMAHSMKNGVPFPPSYRYEICIVDCFCL